MTATRASLWSLAGGSLLVLSGCGSSPDPIFYALAPRQAPPRAGWAHMVELRRVALPGYLDRSEIVSRVASYRLRVASGESWSEPLGDMVGRVLGEDLADRLPGSIVFGETSPLSVEPDAIVSVDIQRFDEGDDGRVALLAEVTVERPPSHVAVASRRVVLEAHLATAATRDLVAAMSVLVGELADQVAALLRNDASGGPGATR